MSNSDSSTTASSREEEFTLKVTCAMRIATHIAESSCLFLMVENKSLHRFLLERPINYMVKPHKTCSEPPYLQPENVIFNVGTFNCAYGQFSGEGYLSGPIKLYFGKHN